MGGGNRRGHVWQGGMRWQRGACMAGGACGRGHVWQEGIAGACVAGGEHAW